MNTQILKKLRAYPKHGQTFPGANSSNISQNNLRDVTRTAIPDFTPAAEPALFTSNTTVVPTSDLQMQNAIQQQAQILARQMLAQMQQPRLGRVYTKFDMSNDIINNQTEVVTAGIFSDGIASLTTHFTGSAQTATQRKYYLDIYQKNTALTGSEVQYTVTYGHALGSGSDSVSQLNDSPSKAIYSQYRQLLLPKNTTRFSTPNGNTDSIYVLNIKRSRLKERMDPGNFELPLCNFPTPRPNAATGSISTGTTVYTLIDDSTISNGTLTESGRVYNIVSGSLNSGVYNVSSPDYYGLLYPDHGVMILNGDVLDSKLGFNTVFSSSFDAYNHFMLYHSISGSGTNINPATSDPYGFQARNSEKITSTHYFVRVKNAEYNFSNNPSYTTGSVGQIAEPSFIGDPKTYITTVGLYNDRQELLAVAKLSKPLLKSFQREALIRVKLDF